MDLLFILHADHEQNCSTSTVRMAGSSGANPVLRNRRGYRSTVGPCSRRRERGRAEHA